MEWCGNGSRRSVSGYQQISGEDIRGSESQMRGPPANRHLGRAPPNCYMMR